MPSADYYCDNIWITEKFICAYFSHICLLGLWIAETNVITYFDVFSTVYHSIDLLHLPTLMHDSFIHYQYICYITILDMFRASTCPPSGGQIIFSQHLVSPLSVQYSTVCRLRADPAKSALIRHTVQPFTESGDTRCCENKICPPEDGYVDAGNIM